MKKIASSKPIVLEDLAAPFARMGDDEAIQVAAFHYGLKGTVDRLVTEKDDTFRLQTENGRRFILKIANPVEPQSEIDLQVSLLEYIEKHDPSIPVPRVIPNKSGASHFIMEDAAGQKRSVRVMSYLEGRPLDALSSSPGQREAIGSILARLRLCMSNFDHPAAERILAWDVKNLAGLSHLAATVKDPHHRDLLELGLERFYQFEPQIHKLRTQVLHNDFSKSNIVVDPEAQNFVTGVIDFGDTVNTAIAIDVSTALLNQLPRNSGRLADEDIFSEPRDLLRGYLRIASLDDEELALIPHLVMSRVITRALLSLRLAESFPENSTYLLRNTLQGWAQLDWFLRRTPDEISSTLTTTV